MEHLLPSDTASTTCVAAFASAITCCASSASDAPRVSVASDAAVATVASTPSTRWLGQLC